MSLPLAVQLTAQFYDWENRGRGWYAFNAPVDLEPPFMPFFFHSAPTRPMIDDGKRPTILSTIGEFFKPKQVVQESEDLFLDYKEIEPYIFENIEPVKLFRVSLPKEQKVKPDEIDHLLLMLSSCQYPLSFEIVANHTAIYIQFVCREADAQYVYTLLKAYFPDSSVQDKSETLWDILGDKHSYGFDFGLKDEFMRPINMADSFEIDPFIGIFSVLENLREDEQAVIQILFQGAVNPWAESIMRSVTDHKGGHFFEDSPEMLPLAKEKVSSPLCAVVMRIVAQSNTSERAEIIARQIGSAISQVSRDQGNQLIPLGHSGLDPNEYFQDVHIRQSHRLGMLLNSRELATFVHLPSASVVSAKLEREIRKTKAAPSVTEDHEFILGINNYQGKSKTVSLASAQRLKHLHCIGATGTGKSTFLLNCIVQDINNNNGLAVLDPHGDLIESILQYIPENRHDDVVLIDPSDSDFPVGFNILTAHSEIEKDILSSDLVTVFRKLSTSWGDQMNSVFSNAILAFLESDRGGTLIDLRRFLIEKSFRDQYLKSVTDPNIAYYWQKEFPLLKSSSIGPILTRLDTFLRPKLIRNMVAQKQSLNFEHFLDSGKIVLVKLSQGLIGTENSYLLGTFIVAKIHQAALARQARSKESRRDFFLYIDEFQNFITQSMEGILSGARKYHLGLILAHQDMQQVLKHDSELASSVMANPGTRICFRVGDQDAKRFEDGFSYFEAKDLQNLAIGEAIVRVDRPEFDFNLKTSPLPESEQGEERTSAIIAKSREKYGTPRHEVENILQELREEVLAEPTAKEPSPPVIPKASERAKEEVPKPIQSRVEPKEIPKEKTDALVKKQTQSQHRYLQTLVKRMAESRGYKAVIEEPTPDGKGRVDVALERNGKRIACEISVTTGEKWEMQNIQKCITAGFALVVQLSTDRKYIESIQKEIEKSLEVASRAKVMVLEPEAFFAYLDQEIAKEAKTETRIKGYRVNVEYDPISEAEMQKKRESVAKVVIDSMKKMKDKK
jgi:hypothetical protein